MTGHELQQELDQDSFAAVPQGTTVLESPLFLDSGRALVGLARQGSRLDAYAAGTGIVAGWRRGLVPDTHLATGYFRTLGTVHLLARGTEWDLGPIDNTGVKGWPSLNFLRVYYSGIRNGPTWVYHTDGGVGGEPFEQVLCGIQASDVPNAPRPAPWLLWWSPGGVLTISFRTYDGAITHHALPGDPLNPDLVVDVTADLVTGTITGTVNGVGVNLLTGPIGSLADNDRWPFAVGKGEHSCNASGFWGGGVGDVTVREIKVESASWFCRTRFNEGRALTYEGGPSLPLVKCWTNYSTRWLWMVHQSQGVPDSVSDVAVRGLTVQTGQADPVMVLGAVQLGGVRIEDVGAINGSRFVQTQGLSVCYPVHIGGCLASFQSDRQLWLQRASHVSVRDSQFNYGVRASASLLGCTAEFDNVYVQPPGPPAQGVVIEQIGGVVGYTRVGADYEYVPGPAALVAVEPFSFEGADWPTTARITACGSGSAPLFAVGARPAGYTGPVRVDVDGAAAHLS